MEHKLPLEIKAKWLEALRSGQYLQGKDFLSNIDEAGHSRFCCLGVLADVADPGVLDRTYDDGCGDHYGVFQDEELTGNGGWCEQHGVYRVLLQPWTEDWDWCGWNPLSEFSNVRARVETALVHANDNGASFEVIANMIERNL